MAFCATCLAQPHPRPVAYSVTASVECNSYSGDRDCATSCTLKNFSTRLTLGYFPNQCVTAAFTTELLGDCPLAGKYPNSTLAGVQSLNSDLPFDSWSLNFTNNVSTGANSLTSSAANPVLVLPGGQGLVNFKAMRLNNFQCGPIAANCQCSVQADVWEGGAAQHETAKCGKPW